MKTVNFIGDSITFGCDGSIWDGNVEKPYPALIEEIFGWKCNNYGIDSSTICKGEYSPICERIKNIDFNADAHVIFAGVNDYFQQKDTNEFRDTFEAILETISFNSSGKIIVVEPLNTNRNPWEKELKTSLLTYRAVIALLSISHKIPVIFTNHIFDFTDDVDNKLFSGDNLHPNQLGYKILAIELGKEISRIMNT